jgi:hypothetical protein
MVFAVQGSSPREESRGRCRRCREPFLNMIVAGELEGPSPTSAVVYCTPCARIRAEEAVAARPQKGSQGVAGGGESGIVDT